MDMYLVCVSWTVTSIMLRLSEIVRATPGLFDLFHCVWFKPRAFVGLTLCCRYDRIVDWQMVGYCEANARSVCSF